MRLDDAGTAEDITVTAISGTTVTCIATTSAHANGNTIDGAIWTTAAMAQEKDDAQSGFPVNALSGAGALVKGTGVRNHITISSAATFTLANGTYTGECCRISMDRTSTKQATVDPAGGTTWDGLTTIGLFAGDNIIGTWDGSNWITIDKYSSWATPEQLFLANNFYASVNVSTNTTPVGSTTVTRYCPFFVPYTITISQIGARVIATNAGNFKMGIYANSASTNQPTGSVLDNTGNLSCASAATVMGALGANLQLTPGIYWFAFQVDNTAVTFHSIGGGNSCYGYLVGANTAADLIFTATATLTWSTSGTTYGTFGASPSITEGSVTGNPNPIGYFKVASVP